MKLLRCKECLDTVKLFLDERTCHCGKTGGYYKDRQNAVYWGPAIPFGFDTDEFLEALEHQPESGAGMYFTAFVIPKNCPTFKKIRRPRKKGA